MHNWSVDTTELKKDTQKYAIWQLEQLVNFGLDGERLDRRALEKYWPLLNLDKNKKKYLSFLLWPKQS
jgi:hypothetical protein